MSDKINKAIEEINAIFQWIEGCNFDVDAVAFNKACWGAYHEAFRAVGMTGVLGYSLHTKTLHLRAEGIAMLREAMLLCRMPLTHDHVDALNQMLPKERKQKENEDAERWA